MILTLFSSHTKDIALFFFHNNLDFLNAAAENIDMGNTILKYAPLVKHLVSKILKSWNVQARSYEDL
jgi:hypothetical protein